MRDLELAGISKRYGEVEVVRAVDLQVAAGEFVVIVGPSGCGKSTLLRLIAGLDTPSAGRVRIGGRDVTDVAPAERGVAMVFQSYALYPHLTVAQNIGFPLKVARIPKAQIETRVARVAASLELSHVLDRRPRELSGGQRQRVSIGRAVIREPQVLLLDEPLSNLDAALRVRTRHEFARLHQELGATMVYVTHDQLEAMTLANRIVVMEAGAIEQVGAPMELYRHPATLAVARAIGSPAINLVQARIEAVDAGGATVVTQAQARCRVAACVPEADVGAGATLGLRPEHMRPDEDGPFAGAVELFERLGPLSFAHLGAGGRAGTLVAQLPGERAVTLGERLAFCVDPADALLFDAAGRAYPPLSP